MNRFLFSLFSFFVLTCLLSTNVGALETEHIVGGDLAVKNQFPYHVSLEVIGSNICGGAILDETHIITAAHCVIDRKRKDFYNYYFDILPGEINADQIGRSVVRYKVDTIYVPTRFITSQKDGIPSGDIALLKLTTPLNLKNSKLSKINLPDPKKTYANEYAIITGYGFNWVEVSRNVRTGALEETDGGTTGELRYAKAKVASRAACQRDYIWPISPDHLCANVVTRDPRSPEGVCSGDSGGPLVYGGKTLIGVVSNSPTGCRETESAAIYTRVSSFLDFIEKARTDKPDSTMMKRVIKW